MTKPKQPSAFETLALANTEKVDPDSKTNMASDAAIEEAKYWVDFNKK